MNIIKTYILGAIFTFIVGIILHFAYEWTGKSKIVALFSPVNESIWEHLKLLFTPMLAFGVIEYLTYGKELANFVPVRVISIILGMITIVVSFYTYSGILGKNFMIADIGTFILGIIVAYWFSYKLLQTQCFTSALANQLAWFILLIMIILFILFTFKTPKIGIFKDPITGTYGKKGN